MIDKLHLTISNRTLKAAENLYSGESILVEVEDSGLVQLQASSYRLIIFGADKSILAASGNFTASDTKWTATLNMATTQFQTYYENVSANSSKTLGMMIADDATGDTLCAGTVSVTAVPFPSQISSIPDLYGDAMATLVTTKIDKVVSAVENNMAVFDSAGGVKDVGLKIKRQVTTSEHGVSYGSLGIGDVRGIAEHDNSLAVGDFGYTDINGDNAVAVGMNCAAGENSVAIGEEAGAEQHSVVVGYASCEETGDNVIVGNDSGITGDSTKGVVVGNESHIDGDSEGSGGSMNSVAIGYRASVNCASNAVQLGTGTNSTPGTLQFRSFPLMDAQGKIAKQAIGGHCYLANQAQNTFIIDGRCYPNIYFVYSSNNSRTYSTVFDYSSMTYPESDHFLVFFQGAPKNLDLVFRTAGEDEEEQRAIKDLDIFGAEIDWTSDVSHEVLFLVIIDDPSVPPSVFALTKWVSS